MKLEKRNLKKSKIWNCQKILILIKYQTKWEIYLTVKKEKLILNYLKKFISLLEENWKAEKEVVKIIN